MLPCFSPGERYLVPRGWRWFCANCEVRLLFSQVKAGIASRIERLTAEGGVVIAQTSGAAGTTAGTPCNNTCCQVITIRDGQTAAVMGYMDTALIDSVFGAA